MNWMLGLSERDLKIAQASEQDWGGGIWITSLNGEWFKWKCGDQVILKPRSSGVLVRLSTHWTTAPAPSSRSSCRDNKPVCHSLFRWGEWRESNQALCYANLAFYPLSFFTLYRIVFFFLLCFSTNSYLAFYSPSLNQTQQSEVHQDLTYFFGPPSFLGLRIFMS